MHANQSLPSVLSLEFNYLIKYFRHLLLNCIHTQSYKMSTCTVKCVVIGHFGPEVKEQENIPKRYMFHTNLKTWK